MNEPTIAVEAGDETIVLRLARYRVELPLLPRQRTYKYIEVNALNEMDACDVAARRIEEHYDGMGQSIWVSTDEMEAVEIIARVTTTQNEIDARNERAAEIARRNRARRA